MKKRVFRKKWLFVFSAIFLPLITFGLITETIESYLDEFNFLEFLYLLLATIFFILSCFKLFRKDENTVIIISVSLLLFLFFLIYNILTFSPFYIDLEPENLIFILFMTLYIVLINKYKLNSDKVDSIEEIGKREL